MTTGRCPCCDHVLIGDFRQHMEEKHPNAYQSWEELEKLEDLYYGREQKSINKEQT